MFNAQSLLNILHRMFGTLGMSSRRRSRQAMPVEWLEERRLLAANIAPVIDGIADSVLYSEGGAPAVMAPTATVVDPDSSNFASGKLTVSIAVNGQPTDRISIQHTGNGEGQIGVRRAGVFYGGTKIGTFRGTTSLTIKFNRAATPAAVQALVRSMTFSSVAATLSPLERSVKFVLTDGDGGTSNAPSKLVKIAIAINGTEGDDNLIGNSDPDIINGFGGNDTIEGQGGDDVLNGGDGNDTYVFALGFGRDLISDASGADDRVDFGSLTSDVLTDVGTFGVGIAGVDSNSNGFIDSLRLDFDDGSSLTFRDYFYDSVGISAGPGVVEFIDFADFSLDFSTAVFLL